MNNISFVIQSFNSPMKNFMLCVISTLMRTQGKVYVSIHGPDKRTGDDSLQNLKYQFLLELQSKKLPIYPIRIWSRVGADEAIEMALSYVETKYYAIIDDNVALSANWSSYVAPFFQDDYSFGSIDNLTTAPRINNWHSTKLLTMPGISKTFVICDKVHLADYHWNQYSIPAQEYFFEFDLFGINKNFFNFWSISEKDFIQKVQNIRYESGAWINYHIKSKGLKTIKLNEQIIVNNPNWDKFYPKEYENLFLKYGGACYS